MGLEAHAGEIEREQKWDQEIWILRQDGMEVRLAPASGANVFSIRRDGCEYLHPPESADSLLGVRCGVPVLYPTPNRVRGGEFQFEGQTVTLPTQGGGNHIHGLVNRVPWQVVDQKTSEWDASLTCALDFTEGEPLTEAFPFPHTLRLTIRVTRTAVRWNYVVDNRQGETNLPFGFALHPYFTYQGSREQTFLTIPATHWMEAENQLPSGKLVPAAEATTPLGKPFSLQGRRLDDVFWGLTPDRPTFIDFRETQRQISIVTSEAFTHLVVWTPDRPFFGVESQTCSTDAHNLYSVGQHKAAHLQICPPGKTMAGWVEYQVGSSK